jgi:hypothetical protein
MNTQITTILGEYIRRVHVTTSGLQIMLKLASFRVEKQAADMTIHFPEYCSQHGRRYQVESQAEGNGRNRKRKNGDSVSN